MAVVWHTKNRHFIGWIWELAIILGIGIQAISKISCLGKVALDILAVLSLELKG